MTDKGTGTGTGRRALGRGLSALIPGASNVTPIGTAPTVAQMATQAKRDFFECAIEDVYPDDANPRQNFDELRLNELAESIRVQGLVQPLVVRERKGGGYTLIAGERRWRAAQRAGLKALPVVVKKADAKQAFELALVENLQREDLNPIEEADGYRRLSTDFGYTQEQLAERVGKDRATVANALRLLKLPEVVRQKVADGSLSMGHARALLGLDEATHIVAGAAKILLKHWSVRQTEEWVRKERQAKTGAGKNEKATAKASATPTESAAVRDLVTRLERSLGTKVRLAQRDERSGTLEIDYHSLDQLDTIIDKIFGGG